MKILLILPKFHKKTLSHPENIKIFRLERRMHMHTVPPGDHVKLRNTINEMCGNITGVNTLIFTKHAEKRCI